MLQNNPLKSDIEQMNDWEAFKEHIQHSVDKQVVSNKTVIMILFIASNEYRDCNGNWVYKASVSVSDTSMNVGINARMCNLCRNELFRVNIPIISPTASNLVFLVTCCGSSAPLYSGVTGAQLTATSLTAGVTYVITYDKFTRKFFVTGV